MHRLSKRLSKKDIGDDPAHDELRSSSYARVP